MIQIHKVKISSKGIVTIHYTHGPSSASGTEEIVLTSEDAPKPELNRSMQSILPYILSMLELPSDYGLGGTVRVSGVTRSKNKVVFTATKILQFSNSPFNIVTPPMLLESEEGGENTVSDELYALVEEVFDEATRYVNGDRLQTMLNFEGPKAIDVESKEVSA